MDDDEAYTNTFTCLYSIFKKEGFLGWFKGLDIKLLQTILTAAFRKF